MPISFKYLALITCLLVVNVTANAADNLLLVSIDGLRWQEVFRGYQDDILSLKAFEKQKEQLKQDFAGSSKDQKRQKLMPFLWREVAKKGLLIGNRDLDSKMHVTNELWFSYPGYNEILTGKPDSRITSNKAIPNLNITILEWIGNQDKYQNKVAAFGSWDVFPAIINRQRSGVMVNAGFESASWSPLSKKANWLNELQKQIPSPWHNVRLDAFTYGFAKEYIQSHQPKVIYLALGETDDFAHQGNYPEYLRGALRSDNFIANIWNLLQSMDQYKDNTNILITVDHGRGNSADTWQHHASPKATKGYLQGLAKYEQGIVGANHVWLAAMGPDVKNLGEVAKGDTHTTSQVAATAITLLGLEPSQYAKDIGLPLPIIKK